MKNQLGEVLIGKGLISASQLGEALKQQQKLKLPIGETLLNMVFLTEEDLLKALSDHLRVNYFNIAENDYRAIDKSLAGILTHEACQRLRVVPLFHIDDGENMQLTIATANPLDQDVMSETARLTNCEINPVLTTSSGVIGGIKKLFAIKGEIREAITEQPSDDTAARIASINKLLVQAVQFGASDIHIEPHAGAIHIRLRIDGVLELFDTLPSSELPPIVIRFKVLGSEKHAAMRTDQKWLPHDGSFARVIGNHAVDFRVSTFPTIYGEKVVIRIFDKDSFMAIRNIVDLNLPSTIEKRFRQCLEQTSGIIISTGPTGSGKSTTLHAALSEINTVKVNIVTIEDPVEYHASDYINQSNLMPKAGFTYAAAMRSILRQDPDVIMVGEIRDLETAKIGIQAALTGHLVLATLHTDDAAGAVMRLVDLGIEQFMVSTTVVSAINQRLVRKLCPHCEEKHIPTLEELTAARIDKEIANDILGNMTKWNIKISRSCKACRHTGYMGRQAAFEMLTVTPAIKRAILAKKTSEVIAEEARKAGDINMLFEETLRLVLSGVTTFEELKKIPRGDYKLKAAENIFKTAGMDLPHNS